MKTFLLTLAAIFATSTIVDAQEYHPIDPELRCHQPRKDRSFSKMFPQFSFRHGVNYPQHLGAIELCRKNVTITEPDSHGNMETYNATVVTYRAVYANGARGRKFSRTYRVCPHIVTPPLAKNVYSK